uniref:Neur_chan_LBD domain-containing protein n=1 Tax=Panagrellus redivivus TaxID=6233 RepID=A0A7E4VFZ1_PANRE
MHRIEKGCRLGSALRLSNNPGVDALVVGCAGFGRDDDEKACATRRGLFELADEWSQRIRKEVCRRRVDEPSPSVMAARRPGHVSGDNDHVGAGLLCGWESSRGQSVQSWPNRRVTLAPWQEKPAKKGGAVGKATFPKTFQSIHPRDLLANYSSLVRPVKEPNARFRVTVRFFLQQIVNVDEKNQVIELNAWLKYVWYDYRLKWKPDNYEDIGSVRFSSEDNVIFQPDVLLYNSADKSFDSTYKSNLVVYHTGEVNWIPPGIFRASCRLDVTYFPFDDQSCFLKFGSWTYHGYALDLQLDTDPGMEPQVDLSTYIPNGEWYLKSCPATRKENYYECCPEPYPTVYFWLNIRRRTLYYIFNLIIPSLLISSMTLLGFCLPAYDMAEKIGFQTTILLSVCFFLTVVGEMTPPTSEAIPLLGVFFSTQTLLVSISTAFTIMVLNIRYRQPANHKMSHLFQRLFLVWLPWLLMMRRPEHKLLKNKSIKIKNKEILEDECIQCIGIDVIENGDQYAYKTAEELFKPEPLFAEVYQIPVDRLGLERKVGEGIFPMRRCTTVKNKRNEQYDKYVQKCVELLGDPDSGEYDEAALVVINYYKRIHARLKYILEKMTKHEREENLRDDYRFASMVLDRLCLVMFSFLISVCIAVIFMSPPYLYA